eukprot:m.846070 g.846070  ORF g.846070 m.846070 type:complete len:68 (-) comp23477_c1_seq71:111-314(-)
MVGRAEYVPQSIPIAPMPVVHQCATQCWQPPSFCPIQCLIQIHAVDAPSHKCFMSASSSSAKALPNG